MVLVGGEIEEVVIDLDAISDELDGVGVEHEVMVDVEGFSAFRNGPTGVFRNGEGAVADVVIDFVVLVVFEGKFHGEIDLDSVVVKA